MQQDNLYFTAGQFARLHNLNKRTLHYYDEIGLFSPAVKGSNGYRYYTWRQSMELENILALREIGMSIGELQDYLKNPSPQKFSELALQKTSEIDRQIKHLRQLKTLLHQKQKALKTCEEIYDGKIEVEHRPSGSMLLTPILAAENTPGNAEQVMAHLKAAWAYSFHKAGCGSYISLEKVSRGQYNYDGLFTPVPRQHKSLDLTPKPEGSYLCGYCVGGWDKIPSLYERMLAYAAAHCLVLTGNCYETGLNEFAISSMEEYVTQIEILCKD